MDVKVLKADILSNTIPNFMIFIQEEPTLAKQYIDRISSTISKKVEYYDSVDEMLRYINDGIGEDFLFILYQDNKVFDNIHYIDSLISSNRNIIVLTDKVDTKKGTYTKYKDFYITFNRLDEDTLVAYSLKLCRENSCRIDQSKLSEIVDRCECDLGKLLNELDKVFMLEQDNSNILVDYLLNNGFSDYRNVSTESFANKVLKHDLSVFDDIVKLNESPVDAILVLYYKARASIQYNVGYNKNILKYCYNCYTKILDGTMNPNYALKYLLSMVL